MTKFFSNYTNVYFNYNVQEFYFQQLTSHDITVCNYFLEHEELRMLNKWTDHDAQKLLTDVLYPYLNLVKFY